MALFDIPLDRISEADLRRLIAAGASESLYIDYKRATYGGKDTDHAELLADVSSFANTAGGDLVIGIAETGGVRGVPLEYGDAYLQHIADGCYVYAGAQFDDVGRYTWYLAGP